MEWDEQIWERRHELLSRCWLSRIYHRKRERFFDICDKLTKIVSVVGGTTAVITALGTDITTLAGGIVAVAAIASLGFDYAGKARAHDSLARQFIDIESRIYKEGIFNDGKATEFEAEIIATELDEPRTLGALVRICQNELAASEGHIEMVRRLSLPQRLFAHFYDFDLTPTH